MFSESTGLEAVALQGGAPANDKVIFLCPEFDSKPGPYRGVALVATLQCSKKNQFSTKSIMEASIIFCIKEMVYKIWHPLDYWSTKQYNVGH